MKHSQKIVVVGGGIMGLLASHALKQLDPNALITMTDSRGFPSQNASAMAGGMLAPYSEVEYLPPGFLPAALDGLGFWKGLSQDLPEINFKSSGSLIVSHPSDRHILRRFESLLKAEGMPYHHIGVQDLNELESSISYQFDEGLFIEGEAHLNPHKAMEVLIDSQASKMTEHFDMESERNADWVIDCRGMGSDDPELRGVKGETLVVHNPEFHLERPLRLMHPRYPLYIVPRGEGVFMIGATIIESSDSDAVSLRSAQELMSALHVISPSFAEASIIDMKAGVRPAYPDNLPRIKIDDDHKVISCNGLFRHGYLLAPVMAECAAAYIAGEDHQHMSLFRKDDHESHDQRAA